MPKPLVLPPMHRKRGNPNWGQPCGVPHIVTEFEQQVKKLGLTKDTCAASSELRSWCESNRNRCYIPEWLLESWRIPIDSIFSG
jgi:hypothetical protein